MYSYAAIIHGLINVLQGVFLIASPPTVTKWWRFIASHVAGSMVGRGHWSTLSGASAALIGALLCAYGVAHMHIGTVSPKAAAVMVCSEGLFITALLLQNQGIMLLFTEPFLLVFVLKWALFMPWAVYEYKTASVAEKMRPLRRENREKRN